MRRGVSVSFGRLRHRLRPATLLPHHREIIATRPLPRGGVFPRQWIIGYRIVPLPGKLQMCHGYFGWSQTS